MRRKAPDAGGPGGDTGSGSPAPERVESRLPGKGGELGSREAKEMEAGLGPRKCSEPSDQEREGGLEGQTQRSRLARRELAQPGGRDLERSSRPRPKLGGEPAFRVAGAWVPGPARATGPKKSLNKCGS